ncbi:MAG: transcriptional regulator NrdR [Alphaproteobacteria bacterium]|nr:transcriptional regulator NrdR [Alphaproteobacteria bacterium]
MRCPYCNSSESQVKDSRPNEEDATIRRRRVCNDCGAKFTTLERVQLRDLMVRKSNGILQPFDREKLARSVKIACRKRDISDDRVDKFITSIHRRLEAENTDDIISSETIGQMVSESLLHLDPIAFVRFASVYRKFSKLADFKKIINQVPEAEEGAKVCELPKKYKNSLF